VIHPHDLPQSLQNPKNQPSQNSLQISIGTPLQEVERRLIQHTLDFTQGDKRKAAQLLGIATRTIYRKLET
jgi:two-component system response regulator HydG